MQSCARSWTLTLLWAVDLPKKKKKIMGRLHYMQQ